MKLDIMMTVIWKDILSHDHDDDVITFYSYEEI